MPQGGGSGEGGLAQRGYGGVAQPGGNVSSGVGGAYGYAGGAARGRPGFGPSAAARQAAARRAGNPVAGGIGAGARPRSLASAETAPVAPTTITPPDSEELIEQLPPWNPTPPDVQSGAYFPGTSANVSPPVPGRATTTGGAFTHGTWGGPSGIGSTIGATQTGSNSSTMGQNNMGWRRQFGGPVDPGRQYTVGENGPERFVPSTPGTIVPNNPADRRAGLVSALQGKMGGGAPGITGMGGTPMARPVKPPMPAPMPTIKPIEPRPVRAAMHSGWQG